jgi:hypothetical protein
MFRKYVNIDNRVTVVTWQAARERCDKFVDRGAGSVVNGRLTIKIKLNPCANSIFRTFR